MAKERPAIQTHWSAMISYNDNRSAAGAHGGTLAELLADIVRTAHYYMTLYPAAEVRIRWIEERCTQCGGTGKVRKARLRQVRCPACRGKPMRTGLGESVAVKPHECLLRLAVADMDAPVVNALKQYLKLDNDRRGGCEIEEGDWAECHQAAQEALGAGLVEAMQP